MRIGRVAAAAAAISSTGAVLAGCGSSVPPGALHAGTTDKFSYGNAVRPGHGEPTFAQEAVVYRDALHGVTIERVRPLSLETGTGVPYLGAMLLEPPKVGFGTDLSKRFPHLAGNPGFVRLPYTSTSSSGAFVPALGFAVRGHGATQFSGIAVDYRENGHSYTATVPIALRVCGTSRRVCEAPAISRIPDANVSTR